LRPDTLVRNAPAYAGSAVGPLHGVPVVHAFLNNMSQRHEEGAAEWDWRIVGEQDPTQWD